MQNALRLVVLATAAFLVMGHSTFAGEPMMQAFESRSERVTRMAVDLAAQALTDGSLGGVIGSTDSSSGSASSVQEAWNESLAVLKASVAGKPDLEAKVDAFAVAMEKAIGEDASEEKLAEMVDAFMTTLESDPNYAGLTTKIDEQVAETEKVIEEEKNATAGLPSSSSGASASSEIEPPQPASGGAAATSARSSALVSGVVVAIAYSVL